MTSISPDDLSTSGRYRLLTGLVVPRPIAWVTSSSSIGGTVNLAPFSCYTFVCYEPMLLAFVVGKRLGQAKDTSKNIHTMGEFVVHVADSSLAEAVHFSAVEHPADVSEVDHLRLETTPSETVDVPRLVATPAAMECRLQDVIEFGDIRSELIIGQVTRVHVRDGLLSEGKIDTEVLDPLARVAGPKYSVENRVIALPPIGATMATPDKR